MRGISSFSIPVFKRTGGWCKPVQIEKRITSLSFHCEHRNFGKVAVNGKSVNELSGGIVVDSSSRVVPRLFVPSNYVRRAFCFEKINRKGEFIWSY